MTDRRREVLNAIQSHRLVAIARNISPTDVLDAANALYQGGIRLMEITFPQDRDGAKDTVTSIERIRQNLPDDMIVGAGTVLTLDQMMKAKKAGAEFILSPGAEESIVRGTRALGMVSIPGAFTASEVYAAYSWGADVVKLFPAGVLGCGYLKALRGPLNQIPLMVVGGIHEENIGEFLKAGAMSFGVGSNILKREYIKNKDYKAVTKLAETYLGKIKEAEDAILDYC